MVEWLEVTTEIVAQLRLKHIAHFTTLQKAAARLSDIFCFICCNWQVHPTRICPDRIFAGVGATGFETSHAAPYTTHMEVQTGAFIHQKMMSACSDMKTQLVCAIL